MSNDRPYTSEGNSIIKFLWNALFVLFYPLITTFSLLFMGVLWVFSGISRLLSKISTSSEAVIEIEKPEWEDFIISGNYSLESLYVDEIMFGPAYYELRSQPHLAALDNRFFSDIKYPFASGILLQAWNTTHIKEVPDFQLVYLNTKTGIITELQQIKSFSWNFTDETEDSVTLKWFTGIEGGEVLIKKEALKD